MKIKKNFYTLCVILLTWVLLLSTTGCSKGSSGSQNSKEPSVPALTPVLEPIEGFSVYENPEFSFRIQYPEEWEKMDGENGVAFIIPGDKDESDAVIFEGLNILFEKMFGVDMSLEEYMNITNEGMKKYMPGFNLIESGQSTLGDHPAYKLLYYGIHESLDMKFFSMFALRNGNVYSLSFNSIAEHFDTFQGLLDKIISSFQFLD